jgi:U3 small nucleolar RNA-associated protein 7
MKINLVKDNKVKSKLKRDKALRSVVNKQLEAYEYVNPAVESGAIEVGIEEEVGQVTQASLRQHIDVGTSKKLFDFKLSGGPFHVSPTRNGRHMLLSSLSGQVSVIDRIAMKPLFDTNVEEAIVDSTFLHNHTMFATAQRKCAYIYDGLSGAEIHRLKDVSRATHLDFLPFHFLLVSWSENGIIRYLDTSTGQGVAKHFSGMGPCHSLRQNISTGVVHVGHGDGHVTLWTPSIAEPVMKLRAHFGPVTAMGTYGDSMLVTGGSDSKWKIWDLRRADQPVGSYSYTGTAPSSIDVSQTGAVAIGNGPRVTVYPGEVFKTKTKPLLGELTGGQIESVRFCPFEDILLLGSDSGVGTFLVPGAGSGEFDSFGPNPFETRHQRREGEVKSLIEKLRPDMITLPSGISAIGSVAPPQPKVLVQQKLKSKKMTKRRMVTEADIDASTALKKGESLGVPSAGRYNPLTRFK